MRISIAMGTFNGAKYIQQQLDSLAAQSLAPCELVVCDDGSTDDTLSIVSKFAKSAPFPVRVYKNKINLHFTGNFMKAASLCSGDAIAFCDQDDIWEEQKILACSAVFRAKNDVSLLIHEGRVVDRTGRATTIKLPNLSGNAERFNKAPFENVNKGFAMVMRREVIEEFMSCWDWNEYHQFRNIYGAPLGHDWLVYAWCVDRKKIYFLQEELVQYRIHGENVTANIRTTRSRASSFVDFFRSLATDKSNYYLPAKKWAAEAEFVRSYLQRFTVKQHTGLAQIVEWLDLNSKLWLDRSVIYDREASRAARLAKLLNLLKSGGYLSQRSPRLGIKSLGKDLVVASFPFRLPKPKRRHTLK